MKRVFLGREITFLIIFSGGGNAREKKLRGFWTEWQGGREVQEKELCIVYSICSTSVYLELTMWQTGLDARAMFVHL